MKEKNNNYIKEFKEQEGKFKFKIGFDRNQFLILNNQREILNRSNENEYSLKNKKIRFYISFYGVTVN